MCYCQLWISTLCDSALDEVTVRRHSCAPPKVLLVCTECKRVGDHQGMLLTGKGKLWGPGRCNDRFGRGVMFEQCCFDWAGLTCVAGAHAESGEACMGSCFSDLDLNTCCRNGMDRVQSSFCCVCSRSMSGPIMVLVFSEIARQGISFNVHVWGTDLKINFG